MIRAILLGSVVATVVMTLGFLLLPDTPIYDGLRTGAAMAAGFLTWRPAGQSKERHFASCAVAFVLIFALVWGIGRML